MMAETEFTTFSTPLGQMLIAGNADGLVNVGFHPAQQMVPADGSWKYAPRAFKRERAALLAFLNGDMAALSGLKWKAAVAGTRFQKQVWDRLRKIPPGKTATYGDIADDLGRPGSARAVGRACNANPLGLLVPCHRVIGRNGRLTGYAGGLELKASLLKLEQACREGHEGR